MAIHRLGNVNVALQLEQREVCIVGQLDRGILFAGIGLAVTVGIRLSYVIGVNSRTARGEGHRRGLSKT